MSSPGSQVYIVGIFQTLVLWILTFVSLCVELYVYVTVHPNKFLFNKKTCPLISKFYSCQETLHVSGSSSAHHQEFSTVHSALVYVMQVC